MSLPCESGNDHSCGRCPSPCPDERAKINIKKCYTALFGTEAQKKKILPPGFHCESDCASCDFEFRTREP